MNELDLKHRVAVITGGATGIGYAVAERVLRSGGIVSLWDINGARLKDAGVRLSTLGEVASCALDVSRQSAVHAAAERTIARFGRIDILVNNAAMMGDHGFAWEIDPILWRRVINVNLIAPYLTCRSIVPIMLGQQYGRIINVASLAGKEGSANASHYSASKAGLIGYTKSLAKEVAGKGILVNCVTPGLVNTGFYAHSTQEQINEAVARIPLNRLATTGEVAATIGWLATEDCCFATGAVFDVSGGAAGY